MESTSTKRLKITANSAIFPRKLSKKANKILFGDILRERLDDVKFFDVSNAPNRQMRGDAMHFTMRFLFSLIQSEQSADRAESIRNVLPILMEASSLQPDNIHNKLDEGLKAVCAAQTNEMYERNAQILLNSIERSLSRSNENIEVLNPNSENFDPEDLFKMIENQVNRCYMRFYKERESVTDVSSDPPKCRSSILKTVFSDYRVYPILPALFTLDAINQVKPNGSKLAKTKLINASASLPSLQQPAAEYTNLYKQELRLMENIQQILAQSLYSVYRPMTKTRYYSKDEGSDQIKIKDTPSNGYVCKSMKQFGFLLCNTDKLAVDISSYCGLPYATMLELCECLPHYIIPVEKPKNDLLDKYGEKAREIIMIFHELSQPKNYCTEKDWKAFLFSKINALSKNTKSFFPSTCNNANKPSEYNEAYDFLHKYFKNISLSKWVLARATSNLPLIGKTKLYPTYYNGLIEEAMENWELEVFGRFPLCKHLNESAKQTLALTPPFIPKFIKQSITNALTTNDAIEIISTYMQDKHVNHVKLKNNIQHFISTHQLQNISNYIQSQDRPETTALYQFLLKQSCSIIGHYCAILLLRCNTQWILDDNSNSQTNTADNA